MLLTVLKRFTGNRWKTLSMLVGLILALAMAFGVPMYSDAILQRLLNKTFEDRLEETEKYPAYLSLEYEMSPIKKDALERQSTLGGIFEDVRAGSGLPARTEGRYIKYSMMFRESGRSLSGKQSIVLNYVEGLPEHVTVSVGRMYNPDRNDGVVEAVVRQTALVNSDMSLGQVYEIKSSANSKVLFKMEIVGIIEATNNSDYFWYEIGDMVCIGNKDALYYCFPEKEGIVTKTRLAAEELYKLKAVRRTRKREAVKAGNEQGALS